MKKTKPKRPPRSPPGPDHAGSDPGHPGERRARDLPRATEARLEVPETGRCRPHARFC